MMRIFLSLMVVALSTLFVTEASAQSEVINDVRSALKAGSSKELVSNFNSTVEITIDGNKNSYSRTQGEVLFKDFFRKYPPSDFQYNHQGASKQEGLKYAIGRYSYNSGSFRVYILIKQIKGEYVVDLIDLSKE